MKMCILSGMGNRRVFFQSNHNRPSGGTKVIHQMVNLFRENGFEAFAFSPEREVCEPQWMLRPAPVISNEKMCDLCKSEDVIIGSWPDRETSELIRQCPARIKVFSPQCNFFITDKDHIGAEVFDPRWGYNYFWAVSKSNKELLDRRFKIDSHIVHPFFDPELFQTARQQEKEDRIIAFWRKGSKFVRASRIYLELTKRYNFKIIVGQYTEGDFIREVSRSKFFLHTAIGHQHRLKQRIKDRLSGHQVKFTYAGSKYNEGFPITPAEAAMCGSMVIGFAKNGDLEWMNKDNSFIAKDRSYIGLLHGIERAIRTPEETLEQMNELAVKNLKQFNKENTWNEIQDFLLKI